MAADNRTPMLRNRGSGRWTHRSRSAWLTCALLALFLTPAVADDSDGQRRRPYVRLFSGIGITRNSDLRIHQPGLGTNLTFEQVSWEHRSLSTSWTRDSIPYMGARAGFFFRQPRWLGASIEVLHFKIIAENEQRLRVRGTDDGTPVDAVLPLAQFVEVYRVTNGVNMMLGNIQVHRQFASSPRFPRGRADLYGGVGAGVTIPFTSSVIDGQPRAQYEWGRLATQLLTGLSWHASRHWDLSLEYKFTRTTVDGAVAGGDSRSRLRTNHLTFGFGHVF